MYLRDTDFATLEATVDSLADRRHTWGGSSTDVKVFLDHEEPHIALGQHEVPIASSLPVLASYYNIPGSFFMRLPVDEKQFILDHRVQRSEDVAITVKYGSDSGISEIYPTAQHRVTPYQMGEMLLRIFPAESQVLEIHNSPDLFQIDVVVPEGFDRGIGGDRQVNDLTHGGVRVGQNRKQNLAPWVQTLLYRLACTNGMEIPDYGMKIDGRGMTADEIVQSLAAETRRALDVVDTCIEQFYDMRSQSATGDYTGLFRRMMDDSGLPERTVTRMERTLQDALLAEEEVTMFHLMNHVTNEANNPAIRHQLGARRNLQRVGGQMVVDHAARCNLCHSRLN